ncbi:MAG TPA: tRNA epoxyqueuosine(34) reductase QueG [Candidatus Eisenbacteria bacterium]
MEAERAVEARGSRPPGDASTGDLKERIRAEALRLGFDAVGFARAEEHPDGARLTAWIEAGRHGTMRWMAREPSRRADPRVLLSGARTVISVAAAYYRGDWPAEGGGGAAARGGPRGRVARYAWGRDYHKRVKRRLVRLARAVREMGVGGAWLAAVDTRPMLDRAWAERAGIGWIGKNTNVILPAAGSWFFLGEIVTAIEVAADPPASNHCGTCARCLPACPTGAIVAPYTLDARRCISYLTIEHEGPIPLELRPLIGARVFGCDDCQEACPWNRFAVPTAHPDFAERPEQQTPELIPLLALDDAAFRARFEGTAIRRAGRNRFVRNVAVALGNLGDPRAVPALTRASVEDPDPDVREHAAWALARIRGA